MESRVFTDSLKAAFKPVSTLTPYNKGYQRIVFACPSCCNQVGTKTTLEITCVQCNQVMQKTGTNYIAVSVKDVRPFFLSALTLVLLLNADVRNYSEVARMFFTNKKILESHFDLPEVMYFSPEAIRTMLTRIDKTILLNCFTNWTKEVSENYPSVNPYKHNKDEIIRYESELKDSKFYFYIVSSWQRLNPTIADIVNASIPGLIIAGGIEVLPRKFEERRKLRQSYYRQ